MLPAPPESPDSPPRQPLPRNVRVLGFVSLLNDIASEMIYPLMPQFLITVLGGNRWHLGLIEGVAETGSSLLKLWSGACSDRMLRRKRFVVAGYLLAGIARPVIGCAGLPWHLFALRVLDRAGKGIRTAPRDALIADSTPAEQRGAAFGFHRAMDHLGATIGPVLAALFLWWWPGQLRLLFLLTLVPGILVVALLLAALREPPAKPPSTPETHSAAGSRLSRSRFERRFWWFLATLALFTLGNSSDAFLLVRAGQLGVSNVHLPLLWCTFHAVKSSGNLLAGRAVDRWGPRPLILAGWLMYAVIYLAFALASAAWQIWGLFVAYGLFYALTEPAEKTLVAQLVPAEQRGLAFGWFNGAVGVAALPASAIFGALYEQFGALAAFGWGASLAAAAALLFALLPRQRAAPSTVAA
uniref:MFS transporter n=1 Tax=Schlesneria paludicola TaxID=360056 RepID=A0A7C4LL32_9PLAN